MQVCARKLRSVRLIAPPDPLLEEDDGDKQGRRDARHSAVSPGFLCS